MSQATEPDFDNMTDDEMIEFFALDDAIEDSKRFPKYCCDFCDKENTLDNMTNVEGVKQYISKTTVKGWENMIKPYEAELSICNACFETLKTPCRFETGIIFIDSEDEQEYSYTIEDLMTDTPTDFNPHTEFDLYRDKYGGE
tara:strand:+ start:650 stop:1075 length:426 start_codon:yes stop_codon:yes gene_type:complete